MHSLILRFLIVLVAALGATQGRLAHAQVIANWGTVVTPVTSDVTFSFAQYDINQNFTHQYVFSLEGSAGASYAVTFDFNACTRGCGNPGLTYGIYDTNGGMLSPSTEGTFALTAGSYAFQVKGDGFGIGNVLDYWGSVTIYSSVAASSAIVAPAPEPATWLLLGPGLLLVPWIARRRRALLLAVPAALALQACNVSPPPAAQSQVVARVNGVEISVHQVNHALRVERGTAGGQADRAAVLEKLIDRELAVQQALEQKLDRRVEVLQRLEEMRRDVLASAYAQSVSGAHAAPTPAEVDHFYVGHPELFARRKIYRLREFSLPAASPAAAEVKRRLAARESLEDIERALRGGGTAPLVQDVMRAAEQVPLQALRQLHATPDGGVAVFESPQALFAYQVLGTQSAPLELKTARPLIVEHLARRAGQAAMAAQMRTLRSTAVIERPQDSVAAGEPRGAPGG